MKRVSRSKGDDCNCPCFKSYSLDRLGHIHIARRSSQLHLQAEPSQKTETAVPKLKETYLPFFVEWRKFHQYTHGDMVDIQTDHKPLENIWEKPLVHQNVYSAG